MAGDIRGFAFGLWPNFQALISLIPVEPICEFVAKIRAFDFEVLNREYDFVANIREYDFVAEGKCG